MKKLMLAGAWVTAAALVAACTPTVRVEPPSEPITINLNVKIDHEIRVKVDRELDGLFSEDSDLF
ncbi:MAG: YnbE family lipoprotein [Porticoccaceae bacterium]|nr:YnbE family lipoprotein [Pseudomonadota bacterium]HLS97207.1 YnbE family lipoprotein [Porticoccaceae bacterium]